MAQGWDSARFVGDDDPFARTGVDDPFARLEADPFGSRSPSSSVEQFNRGPLVGRAGGTARVAGPSPVRGRHVVLLGVVLVSSFLVGLGLWGTLSAVRVSSDTFVNVSSWSWLVILGWAGGLVALVWATWATIRAAGHRALPAVALVLSLLLPPFAAFVGIRAGAELAAVQLAGDVEAAVAGEGWVAQLAAWLGGLIGQEG